MANDTPRLVLIPLDQIEPHPLNANQMSPEFLGKLAANIGKSRKYPPLVVRPLATRRHQTLDGEQRCKALRSLGETHAWCYVWPCSDEEALVLLATLNRLEGMDVPGKRAALIAELQQHESLAELARLLPEDEGQLEQTLALLDLDVDALVERLTEEAERATASAPVLFSFAVAPGEAPLVEEALGAAMAKLEGTNRRGRAFVEIVRTYVLTAPEVSP